MYRRQISLDLGMLGRLAMAQKSMESWISTSLDRVIVCIIDLSVLLGIRPMSRKHDTKGQGRSSMYE